MAFAAANSAINTLMYLENYPRVSISSSTQENIPYETDDILKQWKMLTFTLKYYSEVVTASEEGIIIEEARRLQDAIEFSMSTQFLEQSKSCNPTFSLKLDHLIKQDVDRTTKAAEKMRRRIIELRDQKVRKTIEEDIVEICLPRKQGEEEEDVSTPVADMVGLNDEFHRVRDIITNRFYRYTCVNSKEIIFYWINGMAGVGKTTFAKRLYHDPLVKEIFECRAFVRVGREYRLERVLRDITAQLSRGNEEMMKAVDNQDLRRSFWKMSGANKCLIVLDDVWNEHITKELVEGMTIIDGWGSLILLTSRKNASRIHFYKLADWKIPFLNEEESWELLRRKVFGEEVMCPPLLVKAGKKIAKKCGGLPLLINAVAPILLSKADHDPEIWNRVAQKPNSVMEEASNQISEVLITSYIHLDEIYKPGFLYISAFPQSDVVFCSTVIKLWFAEGFHYCLPLLDFGYFNTQAFGGILSNNLVITDKRNWNGKNLKACSLHCAYWYLCKRIAKENRFLYIMNSYANGTDERVKNHHRLAIQTTVLLAIKEVRDMIASIPTVRSLLCTGPYHQYQVPAVCIEWKLLRVLDAVSIRFYEFPVEVVNLILLRYLSLTCNANLPPSISKLWSLQYLIVQQHWRIRRAAAHDESYVPVEVWELQELIHLEIPGVGVESCTKGVVDNIPNLKKLRIHIELAPDAAETLISIYNIKSLAYVVMNPTLLPPNPLSIQGSTTFYRLAKLSLSGCGYPWEEMSKINKLVNLEVLKLQCYAFRGEKWKANKEMKFCKLKYLYIEDTDLVQWSANRFSMLCLERLTMKNCHKLHEIPGSLGARYLKIELIDCNPLAETWAEQYYYEVTASYSWKHKAM